MKKVLVLCWLSIVLAALLIGCTNSGDSAVLDAFAEVTSTPEPTVTSTPLPTNTPTQEPTLSPAEMAPADLAVLLLDGELEYPAELDNSQRAKLALAIAEVLEKRRGEHPMYFMGWWEGEQIKVYYDSKAQTWTGDESVIENATLPLYIPLYQNTDSGSILYYWQNQWHESLDSAAIDFGHIVRPQELDDGTLDIPSEFLRRIIDQLQISFVPAIILDDEEAEKEIFPVSRKGMDLEYHISNHIWLDYLLVNPNLMFGVNVKVVTTNMFVYYPGSEDSVSLFETRRTALMDFEGKLKEGHPCYLIAEPSMEEALAGTIYSKEVIFDTANLDLYLSAPEAFWNSLYDASYISHTSQIIYDPFPED